MGSSTAGAVRQRAEAVDQRNAMNRDARSSKIVVMAARKVRMKIDIFPAGVKQSAEQSIVVCEEEEHTLQTPLMSSTPVLRSCMALPVPSSVSLCTY